MLGFIIALLILCGMFWLGFKLTGAMLSVALWLLIRLPLAIFLFGMGIVFCVTIIFIPLGLGCLRAAGRVAF